MLEILYDLVIQPIWLLLEMVFKIAYSICDNPGISIVFVSLVVNILVLPLYLKSDALQSEERNKQKEMESWVKHIRKNFKGDERFMMLSEYYRQNDYQPWYVLKSSLSLLLQIPFFIAAYRFLSDLQLLHGVSFLFIKDLGLPDATFSIGSFPVNLLPIAMTLINLVSSAIYTKGGPVREKVQTVGMALIFLIFLYNSPAGLVFYWTLNNLFSLGKNVVMDVCKRFEPFRVVEKKQEEIDYNSKENDSDKTTKGIWLLSSTFATIILGMTVPLSVITSSPLSFVYRGDYADPTRYIVTTTAISAGFFLVWGGVAFCLASTKIKKTISLVMAAVSIIFFVNYMFFTQNFGTLFDNLWFTGEYMYSSYDAFLNNMTDLYIVMILIVMARKTFERAHIVSILSVLSVSALLMGVYQTITTSYEVRASEEFKTATRTIEEYKPIMRLSKNGKNVVILVMDKALNGLFPYILNEKPELADAFTGFTYYPNTLSFSACTLQAAPALYGGYEYTTYEMNQRQNESLKDKINESIKILPTLFSKNGFHSTLCDIPLGNLVEYGVPGVFDEIDDCEARELTKGDYDGLISSDEKKATDPDRMKRTFFYFSLTRTAPLMLQPVIYDKGNYNAILPNTVTNEFVRNYVVMKYLPEFTEVVDDKIDEFFVMHNYLAHEAAFLDPPDYMLKSVTNHNDTEGKSVTLNGRKMHIDNDKQLMHYDSNMITYIFLAKWLQRLKDEGVYDNTRIIIAADHGYPLEHFDDLLNKDIGLDAEYINPLLMVKDFDSRGPLKTDDSFMTNADVPTIAMNNVIDDPVNPFTGKLISSDEKDGGSLIVTSSNEWNVEWQFENAYNISDSHWYRVHDSIFDRDNWTVYEE